MQETNETNPAALVPPTLAEADPAAARGQGRSPRKTSRRTRLLAAVIGLAMVASIFSLKAGLWTDFGRNIFQYVAIQAIEYGANDAMNQLNNVDGGYGTGTLMAIIGGATATGAEIKQLSQQIQVAQNMIVSLQGDLDTFETQVAADQNFIALMTANQQYNGMITTINGDCNSLSSLMGTYSNVVRLCFTNTGSGLVLKSNLSNSDLQYFTNFATSIGLRTIPNQVLADLDRLTGTAAGENNIYGTAATALELQVPFEHQVYGSMYKLFNYVTAERAMALYLKKECQSYQWSLQTNTSLSTWMTQYFISDFNGSSGLQSEVGRINGDVTNNAILCKMATALTNSVATNGTQRLAYLYSLITTNYSFSGRAQPCYKVVCNKNHFTYLIPQNPGAFPYQMVENVEVPYPILNYPMNTTDGRFQLEPDVTGPAPTLIDLFTLGLAPQGNPLNFLTSPGGLTNIPSNVKGILLSRTASANNGNDTSLYVLDAQGFNAGANVNGQYLQISAKNITLSQVNKHTSYPFQSGSANLDTATYLTVYYDTEAATTLPTNAAGAFYPTTSGALGSLVSLNTGDVLDLSRLSGPVPTEIRISGNSTLIGGGPNNVISNLIITTFGGNLTISNLFLTSDTNIILNANGPLTIIAEGTNCFESTLKETYDEYGYGNLNCPVVGQMNLGDSITFTGPGALTITTPSTNMPAVETGADIIINGAANLSVSTKFSSALVAGVNLWSYVTPNIFVFNSRVTSRVGSESDDEFSGNVITVGNSTLDMSCGILNPNLIGPCTWPGAYRCQANVKVKTDSATYSGTGANIYLRVTESIGSSRYYNLKTLAGSGSHFQDGDVDSFAMSYSITNTSLSNSVALGIIQSVQLYEDESGSNPHWTCDWVSLSPAEDSGDVPSTNVFTFNHQFTSAGDVQTRSAVESGPYQYVINADSTVAITNYTGPGGTVNVPRAIHGFPVTSIGANAFFGGSLTNATIPDTVTNIANYAFGNCFSLRDVYFQGNAPTLGALALVNDVVRLHYLPETTGWSASLGGASTLAWVPFTWTTNSDCATVTITGYTGLGGAVTIPNSINGLPVTAFVPELFNSCNSLRSVTIPSTITNLISAFQSDFALMGVYFLGNCPTVDTIPWNGDSFSEDAVATLYYLPTPGNNWPASLNGVPTAPWTPFTWAVNPDQTVTITGYTGPAGKTATIPSTLDGLPVTSIGEYAFASAPISIVVIPYTVTDIQADAFAGCSSLTGIFFQGAPPTLGADAFIDVWSATAYCFSGAGNWPATFGGLPTAPWLTVQGGMDAGVYTNLQQVGIIATNPIAADGQLEHFIQWSGPTQYVANLNAANTSINLPAQPTTVTALYDVPPVITAQPQSQIVGLGSNAVFSVGVLGVSPLAYQWYFNGAALAGGNSASFAVSRVSWANAGSYTVIVTNLYGCVTSTPASLTPPMLPSLVQLFSNQVVAAGSTVQLAASIVGTGPLTCRWIKNGRMLTGVTNNVLTIPNASVTDSGTYSMVLSSPYGTAITKPATVTVGTPRLMAWGNNANGQLGDGTTTLRTLPILGGSNVVVAAGGQSHSLFITSDNRLWAMGNNANGQLGDGTTTQRNSPVNVATNVVLVAAGQAHSLYVTRDGTLWGMGDNAAGDLGIGPFGQQNQPVFVTTNVVAIAAGQQFSLYVTSDGTLWSMGYNFYGQLGNGTENSPEFPTAVASNVVAVSAGTDHALFLKADGTLWGMGYSGDGELGDGTVGARFSPVAVGGGTNVVAVAAGAWHSTFLKADGTLWTVGQDGYGQLCDGATNSRYSAACVASNVVSMAAGYDDTLFASSNGSAWSAGENAYGELGNGATSSAPNPTPVSVPGMSLAMVSSGSYHSLGVGSPQPATILTQPVAEAVLAGLNPSFSVAATGFAPLQYQWYLNGSAIRGATSTNYCLTNVTLAEAGNYTVVVTNPVGCVTSTVARLIVSLSAPTVLVWPTASGISFGQTLAASTLSGGSASVDGTFAFTTPAAVPEPGTLLQAVTFTPTDTNHYSTVGGSVSVTIDRAVPSVSAWPTASSITYGQTLAASTLSGGSASVDGAFAFKTLSTAPEADTALLAVTFTPTDLDHYSSVEGTVRVTIFSAATTNTLAASPNPSVCGSNVTFTATVTSRIASVVPHEGTVQFLTNGVAMGAPVALVQGVASMSSAALPAGSIVVQALYSGTANYQVSTASLTLVVQVNPALNPPTALGIANNLNGTVTVTFHGVSGFQYITQARTGLCATNPWLEMATNTAAENGNWTYTESTAGRSARFYRAALGAVATVSGPQTPTLTICGDGSVSPGWDSQGLLPGSRYTITAVSDPDYIFTGWSGSVSGTNATLSFTYQPGMVLQANFTPAPYVPTSGTFYGLFCATNDVTHQNSGLITITTTTGRKYSAKLQIGGAIYSFSGQFDAAGTATHDLTRPHQSPLTIQMAMHGSSTMDGTVSNASWVGIIRAGRAVYDAKKRPAPQAGQYTFLIPGTNGDTSLPAGTGYGTVTVSAGGSAACAVSLADGTKISHAVPVSQTGLVPFYASLYKGQGSLLGWITMTNAAALSGDLAWTKPLTVGGRYPSAFAWTTRLSGARYTVPGKGLNAFSATNSSLALSLNGGGLASTVTNAFTLSAKNQVLNSQSGKLTLSFSPKTGLFHGSQGIPGARNSVSFSGVIVQGQPLGAGYFLGTEQSGAVKLQAR